MPTPPPEVLSIPATKLRRAVELVERYAPPAFANDIAEVRRRVKWILAGLDNTASCTRCARPFTFDAVFYARERMPPPQTCPACRRRR